MQVIIKKQLLEWGEKHQEICKENNDFDERKVERLSFFSECLKNVGKKEENYDITKVGLNEKCDKIYERYIS